VIPLALHCAAALALAALPDDAPTAAAPAASSPALTKPSPRRLLYRGGPIPDGYVLVNEYNASLLTGGMTSLVFGYTGGVIFALVAGLQSVVQIQRGEPFFAFIPLAGPLLALGGSTYRGLVDPETLYLRDVVCVLDAGVQVLGTVLAAVGYFFPTKVLELRDDSGGGAGWLLPLGPGGSAGLRWVLTFGP
jgi:hypothetical protein